MISWKCREDHAVSDGRNDRTSMKDTLPEEMEDLFQLNSHEFLDEGSVRFPRQMQSIKEPVVTEIEEMTEEAIQAAMEAQRKEAYNPYARGYDEALSGKTDGRCQRNSE